MNSNMFLNFLRRDHAQKNNVKTLIQNSYSSKKYEIAFNHLIKLNINFRLAWRSLVLPLTSKKYLGFQGNPSIVDFNTYKHLGALRPLWNHESRLQELFEMADKSKYVAANMVGVDFSEMITIDSYKEVYPFTVILKLFRVFMPNANQSSSIGTTILTMLLISKLLKLRIVLRN